MRNPLLSVVVPFYGVEDYIGDCLESIARQSYRNIEVVLVDDGSPDGSRAIADTYAERDPRFRIVEQPNAGIGEARNTGVRNVEGDYFMFVDSDDMIPRTALEQLVSTVENSGSSFVLSNAKRFSRTSGVRQSWTHQGLARKDVLGTHILELPSLVRDRMLWNKLYLTSFYRDNGYTFPPIRYEDYPIAFEAHLDALTVDIVSSPCYYWRERESGDSITQQVFDYGNMLDRVVSAELLLDIAARKASPAVRRALHEYLGQIDFVALVQAFSAVTDDEAGPVLDLCHRLIDRLSGFDIKVRPRLDQLQYYALKNDDVELLRELATFRRTTADIGNVRAERVPTRPWRFAAQFPGRGRSTAPRTTFEYPITAIKQRTSVTDVRWDDKVLVLRGRAEIDHQASGADSRIEIALVNGLDRHPLPVTRLEMFDAQARRAPVGFEVRVDLEDPALRTPLVWPLRFEVTTAVGGLVRVGRLRGHGTGSPTMPPGRWLHPGTWIQPLSSGSMFTLHQEVDPIVLTQVRVDSGRLVLEGRIPGLCRHAALSIARRAPVRDLVIGAQLSPERDDTAFTITLDPDTVLRDDGADDPFTLTATRRLTLSTDIGDYPMIWTDYRHDVSVVAGDRLVCLTRSSYGMALLQHGPTRPTTVSASLDSEHVLVSGVWWAQARPESMTWRRYLPGTDDFVDIDAGAVPHDDGTWTTRTRFEGFFPPAGQDTAVAPGAPDADWTLFVRVDGADLAVTTDPGTVQQVPQETTSAGRYLQLTAIAGTIRTQVR